MRTGKRANRYLFEQCSARLVELKVLFGATGMASIIEIALTELTKLPQTGQSDGTETGREMGSQEQKDDGCAPGAVAECRTGGIRLSSLW